jgi:hypothetical protein
MELGDPPVVAPRRTRGEILREITLIKRRQGPDDPKIERDIAVEARTRVPHKNIARVHIGMERSHPGTPA